MLSILLESLAMPCHLSSSWQVTFALPFLLLPCLLPLLSHPQCPRLALPTSICSFLVQGFAPKGNDIDQYCSFQNIHRMHRKQSLTSIVFLLINRTMVTGLSWPIRYDRSAACRSFCGLNWKKEKRERRVIRVNIEGFIHIPITDSHLDQIGQPNWQPSN